MLITPQKYLRVYQKIYFFITALCLSAPATAQYTRYIVQLTDKQATPFTLDNPAAYLSARSIERRNRQHIQTDSSDLPITPAYLDSIRSVPNVSILNYSKWLNQVLIRTTDQHALSKIQSFLFTKQVSPIAFSVNQRRVDTIEVKPDKAFTPRRYDSITSEAKTNIVTGASANHFNYAGSFPQIHIHKGEYLHNLGFHGEGIVIAVLDGGFGGYLTNPVFDSIISNNQILGTYDYVNQKQSVNEENEHGAYCLSIIAANSPGAMVGSAPKAKFWLFKTEDVKSEYPVEEQNWVAAAEFADSAGADMISTSLGYAYFDDPSLDHSYQQRDGHTTLITRGANFAVAKGMIVTASAGNSGEETGDHKYVESPGDADSVLTVGAIDISGIIAPFSSWGPNAAGHTKPNVVSVGVGTVIASPNGNPAMGNGTSFSNPNMAGLVACLWQAFPEFNNHDILAAVQQSADRYSNPDDHYGFGIPNFIKAYDFLATKRDFLHYISNIGDQWISAFPVPFNNQFTVVFKPAVSGQANIQLIDVLGRIIETKSLQVTAGLFSYVQFDCSYFLRKGVYFIRYNDDNRKATLKIIKE
ncbi:MAG: S8 family serine peptidase [Bacteroidetes bacterium]|nr:S8 family serine peptidase [Bacteroidota bacterium]